jgi:hypothetical protein
MVLVLIISNAQLVFDMVKSSLHSYLPFILMTLKISLSLKNLKGSKHLQEHSLCDFVRNIGTRLKLFMILYANDTIILADSHQGL